jgi:hypothetical protein
MPTAVRWHGLGAIQVCVFVLMLQQQDCCNTLKHWFGTKHAMGSGSKPQWGLGPARNAQAAILQGDSEYHWYSHMACVINLGGGGRARSSPAVCTRCGLKPLLAHTVNRAWVSAATAAAQSTNL